MFKGQIKSLYYSFFYTNKFFLQFSYFSLLPFAFSLFAGLFKFSKKSIVLRFKTPYLNLVCEGL